VIKLNKRNFKITLILAVIFIFILINPVSGTGYNFVNRGTYFQGQTVPVSELTFTLANTLCQNLGAQVSGGYYASNAAGNYGAWWLGNQTGTNNTYPYGNISPPPLGHYAYMAAPYADAQYSWWGGGHENDNPQNYIVDKSGFFNFSLVCNGISVSNAWNHGYGQSNNLSMPIYSYHLLNYPAKFLNIVINSSADLSPIPYATFTLSNGDSGTTGINGSLNVTLSSTSGTFTYSVASPGFNNINNVYLGNLGLTGTGTGYLNLLMSPSTMSGGLAVVPNPVNLTSSVQVTLANLTTPKDYLFYWDFEDANKSNTIYSIGKYKNNSGTWQKYLNGAWSNTTDNVLAPPVYTPVTTGIHNIKCDIYTDASIDQTLTTKLIVNDNTVSTVLMHLGAINGNTGGHLSNYNLVVINPMLGSSRNDTVTYDESFTMIVGQEYDMRGFKSGYTASNWLNFTIPQLIGTFANYQNVILYSTSTQLDTNGNAIPNGGSAFNTSVYYTVLDKTTNIPIQNAYIRQAYYDYTTHVSSSKNGFTDISGKLFLLIPFNSTGDILVTKDGYTSTSDYLSTSQTYTIEKTIYLSAGGISTITPTITPTNIITIPTTSSVQVMGGMIINGSICKNPSNLFDVFDYALCTQGLPKSADRGLLYAMVLIIGLAGLLGFITRESNGGIGMMFGGVVGFIISVILGWIPIFWVIVFVLLGLIIIVLLRHGSG
jgi:hypothetical protein